MIKEIKGDIFPIKIWLKDIEESCMEQTLRLSSLPFLFKHIALMPDAHLGKGMPIGGVIATVDTVIPNAVGVDIGCGVNALRTNIQAKQLNRKTLENLVKTLYQKIPVGFKHRDEAVDSNLLPQGHDIDKLPIVKSEIDRIPFQLGTLGGGNHFIEIQRSKQNEVWVMIHSGSRNLGHKVADYYNKQAENILKENNEDFIPQLAYLPLKSKLAQSYIREMHYCIDFAKRNRQLMSEIVKDELKKLFPEAKFYDNIDVAHNFAQLEEHYNKKVFVHRKGAIRAEKGEWVLIPGSQGTKSYLGVGLGNEMSFKSCSHGAGRVMGRKEAQRKLDFKFEKERMDKLGIVHGIRSKSDLDEAVGAYKDIDEVMDNQKDLVEAINEFFPLAVLKG